MTKVSPPPFLATPENRPALAAIQDLLFALHAGTDESFPNPLYVHGPGGCGKTTLLSLLEAEMRNAGIATLRLSANDFAELESVEDLADVSVLIVEDLQHLPTRYVELLVRIMDERHRLGLTMVFTANRGPGRLEHRGVRIAQRLANRLAGGLVIGVAPMQKPTRLRVLRALAQHARLSGVAPEIVDWLADALTGGGRELVGAVRQLKVLQGLQRQPLKFADVQAHFRAQMEANAPAVERIAEHVGGYFDVAPKQMRSPRRSRSVVLPRQVSMYLARQLTRLTLKKIGEYFGGRDHKTVQHACRKVEAAMKADAKLSGAIRHLVAELA